MALIVFRSNTDGTGHQGVAELRALWHRVLQRHAAASRQRGAGRSAFIAKIYTALHLFSGLLSLVVDTLLIGAQDSKHQQAEAHGHCGGRGEQLYNILFPGGGEVGSGTLECDQAGTRLGNDGGPR